MASDGDTDLLELLVWARQQRADPVIGSLWGSLCSVLGRGAETDPREVAGRLQLSGGNTLANTVRRRGVSYGVVAHDVACRLKGLFERATFRRDDVTSCEDFVLRKMRISVEEMLRMRREVRSRVGGITLAAQVRSTVADAAVDRAVSSAARAVTRRTARKATEETARHALRSAVARTLTPLNALLWGWTVVDLAGPAYRKTIPGVTFVAMLRRVRAHERSA